MLSDFFAAISIPLGCLLILAGVVGIGLGVVGLIVMVL